MLWGGSPGKDYAPEMKRLGGPHSEHGGQAQKALTVPEWPTNWSTNAPGCPRHVKSSILRRASLPWRCRAARQAPLPVMAPGWTDN
jgi:hypothetical protein